MSIYTITYFDDIYPNTLLDMENDTTTARLIFLHNDFEWSNFLEKLDEGIIYVATVDLVPVSTEDFSVSLSSPILVTKNLNFKFLIVLLLLLKTFILKLSKFIQSLLYIYKYIKLSLDG